MNGIVAYGSYLPYFRLDRMCASPPGVRILDFGLSKIVEQDRAATGLTHTQQFLGTPAYMSPEQVQDASRVDAATDVYSLGISLYELASARMPFGDISGGALFTAHLSQEPRPLDDAAPLVPKPLAELVHACLRKRADQRPSAEVLARRLAQLADELGASSAVAIAAIEIRGQSSASTIDQPRP